MLTRRLLAIVDRFLPVDLERAGQWEQLYRGRALSGALLLALLHTAAMVPALVSLHVLQRPFALRAGLICTAFMLVIGCCLWGLRRGYSVTVIANLFIGIAWVALIYLSLATGGFPTSPLLLFLVGHPVLAFLTAGRHSALIWLLAVVFSLLLLAQVEAAALLPQAQPEVVARVAGSSWVVSTLVLFACFYYFDVINRGLAASISRERDQAGFAAAHDMLTGLLNRGAFNRRLALAFERCRFSHHPLTLLLIDLDGFKEINDSLGHHAGDQLLEALAGRLRQGLRDVDTVARLGGDEFAVVLEGMARGAALERVLTLLLRALSEPVTCDGTSAAVSASIGVALWPADAGDADTLLRCADQAMYAAKRQGRNRAAYASDLSNSAV